MYTTNKSNIICFHVLPLLFAASKIAAVLKTCKNSKLPIKDGHQHRDIMVYVEPFNPLMPE